MQEAQKTEAQKTKEKLKDLEESNTTLSTENETLNAKVIALSEDVKAEYVDNVVILAKNQVGDDGDMEKSIKQVVKKYPQFKNEQQQEETKEEKPQFSTGQHEKKEQSESDKWLSAFSNINNWKDVNKR